MTRKLELARCKFLRWNRLEVDDIFHRIEQVEMDIVELQRREDQDGGVHEPDMGELRSKLSKYHSLLRQQETLWRLKSKVQCIQEEDRNTRFFH